MLQQAVSQNRTWQKLWAKCNEYGSIYNYVQNNQCPGHVICPNFADGCLWKGPPGFQKTHMENCEYCGDIKIDLSQQDDLTLSTSTNSGYLSFCSVLKNCFNLLCSICTVLLVVMGMLMMMMMMFLGAALGGISNKFNSNYHVFIAS